MEGLPGEGISRGATCCTCHAGRSSCCACHTREAASRQRLPRESSSRTALGAPKMCTCYVEEDAGPRATKPAPAVPKKSKCCACHAKASPGARKQVQELLLLPAESSRGPKATKCAPAVPKGVKVCEVSCV